MLRFSARAQAFAPVHMYAKGSISSDYLGVPWIIVTRNGPVHSNFNADLCRTIVPEDSFRSFRQMKSPDTNMLRTGFGRSRIS